MKKSNNNFNVLHSLALIVLFLTSYIPLFILIIAKQFSVNYVIINNIFNDDNPIKLILENFRLSLFLMSLILLSIMGCLKLFSNLKQVSDNGDNVIVNKVSNRNSESISYIATYIVPLLFDEIGSIFYIFTLLFLLILIYNIYINSNMILINPILNFKFSILEVEYSEINGRIKEGLLIIDKNDLLIEGETMIKIYPIGFKLYYAKCKEN